MALLGIEHRLAEASLHGDQRIRAVLGGERLDQRLALLARLGTDYLLDLGLNGVVAVGPEHGGNPLGQLRGTLLERAPELPVELAESCLELVTHVVDVGRRLLGIEHTRADLDRLSDGLGGRLLGLGPLAYDSRSARVTD